MRVGKTKAVIDAACALFEANQIDVLLVCCPAQVKAVWLDPELGEIAAHSYLKHVSFDYNARHEEAFTYLWQELECLNYPRPNPPVFVTCSYEFLRQEDAHSEFPKVELLKKVLAGKKVWLVMDEGSVLGNHKSLQVKAMMKLRYSEFVYRVTLMDGTPAGNSPLSLYSKFALINHNILGYKNYFHFRANHCLLVPNRFSKNKRSKLEAGFKNLETITERAAPYCHRLEQKDCLDMPAFVPGLLSVALTQKTWKVYRQMRDEMIAELDGGTIQVNHAAVKALRLAQICSGFLGGADVSDDSNSDRALDAHNKPTPSATELSDETTYAYLEWLKARLEEDPTFKTVVWCRWRPEIERLVKVLDEIWKPEELAVGLCYGGKKDENFLHPNHPYKGAGVMVAQPQSGQYGNNWSKATSQVYLSQGYDLVSRAQSMERVQAANSRATTQLIDVLVTGPDGQRTITHDIIKVLRDKEDLARRTVARWKEVLSE